MYTLPGSRFGRTQFGQAITGEGQGFGLDAVVNTIPLMTNLYLPVNGQPCLPQVQPDCQPETDSQGNVLKKPAVMFDLKAGDFATPPAPSNPGVPGPTQTFVVATGQLPLVIADPEQAGPSAVLYPPAITYAGLPDLPSRSGWWWASARSPTAARCSTASRSWRWST